MGSAVVEVRRLGEAGFRRQDARNCKAAAAGADEESTAPAMLALIREEHNRDLRKGPQAPQGCLVLCVTLERVRGCVKHPRRPPEGQRWGC